MKYFITADTHFGHTNIIRYCGRPYSDLEAMDKALIRNWNERVMPEDTIFILGDFCFKNTKEDKERYGANTKSLYYQNALNGDKVFLRGNHDDKQSTRTLIHSFTFDYGGYRINCVHNPADADAGYEINFVGHIHQNWLIRMFNGSILYNVGVDLHNYMPITIDEALNDIKKIKKNTKIETITFY